MSDLLDSLNVTAEDLPEAVTNTTESNPPEMTEELAKAIIADFEDIEINNGHLAIAHKHGASKAQVAELHAAYLEDTAPVIEEEEA